MINASRALVVAACMIAGLASSAAAQSQARRFEVGGQVAGVVSGEFDDTDIGIGGRFSWQPVAPLGVESEINFYPGDFAGDPPFSRGRLEALFGATARARLGSLVPFARLRSGFLVVHDAPRPFACILIFPPPLACELGSGRTLPLLDIGGGLQVFATQRTFVRVDIGDRLVRYPAPVIDTDRVVRDDAFFGHDFRFAAGGGVQF